MRTRDIIIDPGGPDEHAATLEIPDEISDAEVDWWAASRPTVRYLAVPKGTKYFITHPLYHEHTKTFVRIGDESEI